MSLRKFFVLKKNDIVDNYELYLSIKSTFNFLIYFRWIMVQCKSSGAYISMTLTYDIPRIFNALCKLIDHSIILYKICFAHSAE
jgi:hypothetical protein